MPNKPYAAAAEQNRVAILPILQQEFKHATNILELGSGTGQHAAYFAQHLPHLKWQASDKQETLEGIAMWIDNKTLPQRAPSNRTRCQPTVATTIL